MEAIGQFFYNFLVEVGSVISLFFQSLYWLITSKLKLSLTFKQLEEVGVKSIPVTLITAIFTGMVLAVQSYIGFKRFNAESLVGTVVALSLTRELGPVLTALIVAGRAGSSMAAELGTMKVTEQIDALYTLAADPVQYLIIPRLLAGIMMLPVLTILADTIGVYGGYLISVNVLGANSAVYLRRTFDFLNLSDVFVGLFKAGVFGLIISLIGCYKGFYAEGGAEGVGAATTGTVVLSDMLILISDYFLTLLFF